MHYQSSDIKAFHSGMANTGFATAIAVEAAAAAITGGLWDVMHPMEIYRLQLLVTVALNYDTQTAEAVVTFFKRVTYASDTGRVTLGTVRLIDGTAAGVRLYRNIQPHKVYPGQQILAAITTAGTGGGSIAGDFLPEFLAIPVAEMDEAFVNAAGAAQTVSM